MIFLNNGQVMDLTEEQSINIAKLFFFIPDHKSIRVAGHVFAFRDIDYDRHRKSKLPQQIALLDLDPAHSRPVQTNQ